MNTIKPLPNRRNYGVRDHLSEAGRNIVEMLRLIWLRLLSLPKRFDDRLFADEAWEKPETTPEQPGRNVYSEPFETPHHFYDEEGRWDAVPNWKWILPCALFWIAVLVIYWLA